MKVYLPVNLNLQDHIKKHPHGEIKAFTIEKCKYLLSLLISVPSTNNTIKDNTYEGYVRLKAGEMNKHVGDYNKYWDYLEKTGVISIDHHYITSTNDKHNAKCKGYKYVDKFKNSKIIESEISGKFVANFNRKLLISNKNKLKFNRKYNHLIKHIVDIEITKDVYEFVNKKLENRLKSECELNHSSKNESNPMDQYNSSIYNIKSIESKNGWFKIDNTAGRLHTVLTNLSSDLRNFIRVKGENMASIDIANSQPYFSSILFNEEFYKQGTTNIKMIKDNIRKDIKEEELLLMIRKLSQVTGSEKIETYKNCIGLNENNRNVDFYMYIQNQMNTSQNTNMSRSQVKTMMMEVLFSRNSYQTADKKFFSALFPGVNKVFSFIKENNHALLACLLQNIEAIAILDCITKEVSLKLPSIPILTIHDSIVVPEAYVEAAREIMTSQLTNITGIEPRLKVEYWKHQ